MSSAAPSDNGHRRNRNGTRTQALLSAESIQAELGKVLSSRAFARADCLNRFLRFTVERTVHGQAGQIKEYLLGVEVFDRGESFDPRIDTIVRVQARNLRAKIEEYYQTEGRDDPVRIDFLKGSYVPAFREREASVPPRPARRRRLALTLVAILAVFALYRWSPLFEGRASSARQRSGVVIASRLPSIAVLPFVDASVEKDQEYFCDGITDDLIHALTQVEGLRVVARSSVFRFKGKTEDVRKIGIQLDVGAVLEGSVRRSGNKLRVTARLSDVTNGYHLWSAVYEREMKSLSAIQDEITQAIVQSLRGALVLPEHRRLVGRYSGNIQAYDLYTRGRYFWNKRTVEGFERAIGYFEQALRLDTNYAPAYAGIADAYVLLGEYGGLPARELMPRAKQAARKALEIDESLAEAHNSLAYVSYRFDWDWAAADQHFRRAIELNPGFAEARHWYAHYLSYKGDLDEALAEIRRAEELDPFALILKTDVAWFLDWKRQHDQAVEHCRKILELDPNFYLAHMGLGHSYLAQSNFGEAIAQLERARALSDDTPFILGMLGQAYGLGARREEARSILQVLLGAPPARAVSPFWAAAVLVGLDEKNQALDWLERACAEHDYWLVWLKMTPLFDRVRSEPRFVAILKKLKLDRRS